MSDEGGPDLEEAKALMRDLGNKRTRPYDQHDFDVRLSAWETLKQALLGLDGYAGFKVQLERGAPNVVEVMHSYGKAYVIHHSSGLTYTYDAGEEHQLPIVFDVESKAYVSTEDDTYRVPVPGAPVPRRSVIATILAAVFKEFPEDSRRLTRRR